MIGTPHRISALLLVTLTLTLCPSITLVAGGWVQEVGNLFIKLTYGTSSSNEVYRFDGETKFPTDNGGFTVRDYPLADRGLFLYAEYGVTGDLTLIADATFKRSIITTPVEKRVTEGVGDLGLAVRGQVVRSGPHALALRLGAIFPTGYNRDRTPPLGNGNLNFTLATEYGISFYPIPAYATATLGYTFRPSFYMLSSRNDESDPFYPDYADVVSAEAEAGYTFFNRLLLKASTNFRTTTRSDDNDFDVQHPPETEQYLKVGGGAALAITKNVAISGDIFVTPAGKKSAKSTDIFIGLSWQGNLF